MKGVREGKKYGAMRAKAKQCDLFLTDNAQVSD